jgi:hypothetical protein
MLLLKKEEEKHSLLIAQDEGLEECITEEELNFKEVMRFLKFLWLSLNIPLSVFDEQSEVYVCMYICICMCIHGMSEKFMASCAYAQLSIIILSLFFNILLVEFFTRPAGPPCVANFL